MESFVSISDSLQIKELKSLEQKDRETLDAVISKSPGENSSEELLNALTLHNLISLMTELCNGGEYSIGYKIGMNAAETLGQLYQTMSPIKLFLIKESEKIQKTKNVQIEGVFEELEKTTIIVNDIIQDISKLLLCDSFEHAIKTSFGETEELFVKIINLKQFSSTIPNPHQIPAVYKKFLNNDPKEVYRVYTNFVHYFAGNWKIAIKRLGKIKKSLNDLHKLCPTIRLSIVNEITNAMQNEDFELLPEDIKKSLVMIDPHSVLFFHSTFIIGQTSKGLGEKATFEKISGKLKKIAEILANPLKDVVNFNIVVESTIKCMLMMKELQSQISPSQQQMLQNMQRFFDAAAKKKSITVDEMLAISHKISEPLIQKIKQNNLEKVNVSVEKQQSQGISF
jgi:hypothetical protein